MKHLILLIVMYMRMFTAQELSLPEYVVSECYGDTFNFDCGTGNMIRINRDFFGYNDGDTCEYMQGDCTISNPKSNSLIHRFCTGKRWCTYYMVERRACNGYFSNYQQVEYQCIPERKVTNICETTEFESYSTYISSPNFPDIYPPNLDCSCIVTTNNPAVRVQMEIVFLAIKFNKPCKDWLKIGKKKTCGTTVDLYSGRAIPIEFHSDHEGSHSGFWLHFQASDRTEPLVVRCGKNVTSNYSKLRKRPASRSAKPKTATHFRVPPSSQNESQTRRNQHKRVNPARSDTRPTQENPFTESRKHPHLPPNMDIPNAMDIFPDHDMPMKEPSTDISSPGYPHLSEPKAKMSKQPNQPKVARGSKRKVPGRNLNPKSGQARKPLQISRLNGSSDKPRHQLTKDLTSAKVESLSTQTSTLVTAKPTTLMLQPWTAASEESIDDIIKSTQTTAGTATKKMQKRLPAKTKRLEIDEPRRTKTLHLPSKKPIQPVSSETDLGNIADDLNDIKNLKGKTVGKSSSAEKYVYSDIEVSQHEHIDDEFITDSDYMEYYYYPGNVGGNFSATAQSEHTNGPQEVTLGFIIICVCVLLGIILIVFVVTVVICRRKRLGKNEPRHSTPTPNPPSSDISTQEELETDNDSGRGLLVADQKVGTVKPIAPLEPPAELPSYTKGTGHQSYVDVDSLYAKPIKSGRSSSSAGNHSSGQSDAYEDVVVRKTSSVHSPVECTDSDGSLYCTPTPSNFMPGYDGPYRLTKSVTAPGNLSQGRARGYGGRRRRRGNRGIKRSESASSVECFSGSGKNDSESDNSFSGKHRPNVSLKPKLSHHRILSDSEPDLYSSSEPEMDLLRKRSIASMSELAEVTFVPDFEHAIVCNELDLSISEPSDDLETDWETRSAISI